MVQTMDILKMAQRGTVDPNMDLLYQKEQQIPGSIHYNIRRYYAQHPWVADDTGMLVYHFNPAKPKENYLAMGVEIRCGVEVGKDVTFQSLREEGFKG